MLCEFARNCCLQVQSSVSWGLDGQSSLEAPLVSILVSSGAGYIGSQAAKAFAAAGFRPAVLGDLSRRHTHAPKGGPFISANTGGSSLVLRIIEKYDVKAVLHFATSSYQGESMAAPRPYFLNNVRSDRSNCLAMAGISDVVGSTEGVGAGARMPTRRAAPSAI